MRLWQWQMREFFFRLCPLLLPLSLLLGEESGNVLFNRAEELFAATLHQEAAPLYSQIQDPALLPLAACRLGQIYFHQEKYPEALASLEKAPLEALSEKDREEKILLTALCHKNLGQPERVIESLINCDLKIYSHEREYELGLAYFLLEDNSKAATYFNHLKLGAQKSPLFGLSCLYLARIAFVDQKFDAAIDFLQALADGQDDVLCQEAAFIKGEIAFHQRDYAKAAAYFESTLHSPKAPLWENEAHYHLGNSFLHLAEEGGESDDQRRNLLKKAEELFLKLLANRQDERFVIALAHTYLTQANLTKDVEARAKANGLLAAFDAYTSADGEAEALLMSAESSDSYQRRDFFYQKLTAESHAKSPHYKKGWYLRGTNHYEEAQKTRDPQLFAKAALAFKKAYQLSSEIKDAQTSMLLIYYVQALWEEGSLASKIEALNTLQAAIEGNQGSDALDRLYEAYAIHIVHEDVPYKWLKRIETTLHEQHNLKGSPSSALAWAGFLFKWGQYEKAQLAYMEFVEKYPDSPSIPQALLQASFAAENSQADPELVKLLRQRIYNQYPSSETAPQAYFLIYSLQDYLQGDRAAIKHLDSFKELFPSSPLLINVNYLVGLDLKRDRRLFEGKWARRKNTAQSVQAFSEAEAAFDLLLAQKKIPEDTRDYYIKLRYRSMLERALVHYEVAQESSAAKRDIFLQYAIDILEPLKKELEQPDHPLTPVLLKEGAFCSLHEECLFWLALTYLRADQEDLANQVFDDMLQKYQAADVSSGYYLSRIRSEQGMAAQHRGDAAKALAYLMQAEEASKGKFLGVDEKLSLWICQSDCYKSLGQAENAMLVLSKVINDDSASHLRLKAMFMRAELYEKLGRPELARRQLESVAKMGDEWAIKAKTKLDQDYASP